MRALVVCDRYLGGLGRATILWLAVAGVAVVGGIDHLTGYELSVALFYLGPVSLAAWYAGRGPGVLASLISCVGWYVADFTAGNEYSHSAIAIWNALVRLGFFLLAALLLTALRERLFAEWQLARTDVLTGLYGRRAFEDALEHDLALAGRHRSPITLAYVDLDDFKSVNDTRGHGEGDWVLRTMGGVLRSSLRHADTAARLGGDEFAVVLPDTDAEGAKQVIEKLSRELRQAFAAHGFAITCSIGVVTFLDPRLGAAKAVAAADARMYESKRKGKGRIAFAVLGEPREAFPSADTS